MNCQTDYFDPILHTTLLYQLQYITPTCVLPHSGQPAIFPALREKLFLGTQMSSVARYFTPGIRSTPTADQFSRFVPPALQPEIDRYIGDAPRRNQKVRYLSERRHRYSK